MYELDVTFDPDWDVSGLFQPGQTASAVHLLTAMEDRDEESLQQLLEELAEQHVTLDIGGLPKAVVGDELATRLRLEAQLVEKNMLPMGLPAGDPLRLYLEEIAQLPAAGDPQALAQQLANDPGAANKLAELLFSSVVEQAKAYAGKGVLLLDLIQEGSLGLWKAIGAYTQGDIMQHCNWWIEQYLSAAIMLQAKASGVGEKLSRAAQDYRSVDEKLLAELGRNPTVAEIADGLHMSVEETAAVAEMLDNIRSLNRAKATPEQPMPEEEEQAVEDTAYFQMRQRIADLLADLPEQDVQLLTLRYGLEGGLPMDPGQVGARLGLTEEEVVTREAAALSKLRQYH